MLYIEEDEYAFSFLLDEKGKFVLDNMLPGEYRWEIERLAKGGEMRIMQRSAKARVDEENSKWYSFANVIWHRHKILLLGSVAAVIVLVIVLSVMARKKKKEKEAGQMKAAQIPVAAAQPAGQQNGPSIPPAPAVAFCIYCGARVSCGYAFCVKCGKPIHRPKSSQETNS